MESASSMAGPVAPAAAQDFPLGARVLVVDDEDASRIAIAYILGEAGFLVEQASNGAEALAKSAGNGFDAMLMDIRMPVMDGVRTLEILRRQPSGSKVAVLMFSGLASRELVAKCAMLGADSFVVKQKLDPRQLIEKVAAAINGRRLRMNPAEIVLPEPSGGSADDSTAAMQSLADQILSEQPSPEGTR